jgi:general secretion pathway protein K
MQTMNDATLNPAAVEGNRDGFVIVAVLWLLASLSVLVSVYAIYVVESVPSFVVQENRLRTETLATAAIELAAFRQLTTSPPSRPRRGQFTARLDNADIAIEFRTETSRIDLNAAPRPLLAGLFRVLGASNAAAELYSDRILAWRTIREAGPNTESPIGSGLARQAHFPHVSELSSVTGLPSALVKRASPFVTVYSGRPQINILDASPEVIAALPGMTRDRVNAVLAQRRASPENLEVLLPLLGSAQQFTTIEGGRVLRVTVRIAFDNGHQSWAESVILLFDEGNEPYSVLSWNDNASHPILETSGKVPR